MRDYQNINNRSPTSFRIIVAAVVGFCSVAFLALLLLGALYWSRTSIAQQTEPGSITPIITLDPLSGPLNTPVTIHGQGWKPGSTVLLYTVAPEQTSVPGFATANATVDSEGRFTVTLTLLPEPQWEDSSLVKIIARTPDGAVTTQALFSLIEVAVQPTDTAPPPVEPTSTPPEPTTTPPSVVQQPPPELETALATATTDVNIRGGPGTDYPILGILRAGQNAEVTGLNPGGGWWQIKFAGLAAGRGWVSAQFVIVQETANVPLVQPSAPPAAPPPPPPITEWRGEYYNNPTLSGAPVLVRNDSAVGFGWGPDSPGPGVPADTFSARWTRDWYFSAGVYRFQVSVDDGARLWIDDHLIIDRWRTGPPETYSGDMALSEGMHRVRVEYFEYIYDAQIHLKWERLDEEASFSISDWRAEYFNNPNLEGVPVLVRNEAEIEHNWGFGSPGSIIPADNFSARWLRQVDIPAGVYAMRITADDGVRVWVDDVPVIDSWHNSEARTIESEGYISAGRHWLRIEYYERGGNAQLEVEWYRIA